jgi:hypothetical protein
LNDTITLSLSPSGSQNTGTVITVTVSGANGPSTGPVGLSANGQVIRGIVELTGTGVNTGDVLLNNSNTAACNYPAGPIGTNSPQGPWTTSGTYTATGNGSQRSASSRSSSTTRATRTARSPVSALVVLTTPTTTSPRPPRLLALVCLV